MKYIGVDFGKKNIGISVSDSKGKIASPLIILPNNKETLDSFQKIIYENNIEAIVFGKSLNFNGEPNAIQKEIEKFSQEIIERNIVKSENIFFHNELFSSISSKWGMEKEIRRRGRKDYTVKGKIKTKTGIRKSKKEKLIDDKAATVILQSFLDKNRYIEES